jgi:acetyl esterase/lipase
MIARSPLVAVFGLMLALVVTIAADGAGDRDDGSVDVVVDRGVLFHTTADVDRRKVELRLDLYEPRNDVATSRAAVLLLHGGSFLPQFDRRQPHLVALAELLARRGYVVAAPDYRVRARPLDDPMGTLRDAVDDCREALDWLRTNAAARRVDPARVAVVGSSAGAIVGVSLVGLENSAARRFGGHGVSAFVNLWGSPVHAYRLCNFQDQYPPTLIVHGTADAIVPFSNSEAMFTELRAAGVDAHLFAIPEAPHTPVEHAAEFSHRVVTFLDERLARCRVQHESAGRQP